MLCSSLEKFYLNREICPAYNKYCYIHGAILSLVVFSLVEYHCISSSGGCFTDVTSVGHSSDVVTLYVPLYVCHSSLLATQFTHSHSFVALFTTNNILTDFHHGLDLVIQILNVSSHSVVSDSYSFF